MAMDFWTVEFKINFDNINPEGVIAEGFGWTEKYFIPGTKGAPPFTTAVNLQAARASLLAQNCNIVKSSLRLASMYRDQWSYNQTATYPLVTFGDLNDPDHGYCGTVQDALLIRFESANGRRWNRTIRGIRDAWTEDQAWLSDLTRNSYGPLSPPDLPIPAQLTVGGALGTYGVIGLTNTAGVLSVPVITTAGVGLAINGLASGTFYVEIPGFSVNAGGQWNPYRLNVTLTAGAITAVTEFAPQNNVIYPTTLISYTLPSQIDPLGLPWFLDDVNYVLNFCGLMAGPSSTIMNFHTAHVTPFGPDAGFWPAGSKQPVVDQTVPQYVDAPYQAVRFMIERVTNRQTGRMWIPKKARRKARI